MENRKVGKPLGYRKPNPKKPYNFKLSDEEHRQVRLVLDKMRFKGDKSTLYPDLEEFDFYCDSYCINSKFNDDFKLTIYEPYNLFFLNSITPSSNCVSIESHCIVDKTNKSYIFKNGYNQFSVNLKSLKLNDTNKPLNYRPQAFYTFTDALKSVLRSNKRMILTRLLNHSDTDLYEKYLFLSVESEYRALEYITRFLKLDVVNNFNQ